MKASNFKIEFQQDQSGVNEWDKNYWFGIYKGDTPETGTGKAYGLITKGELIILRNKINEALNS